MKVMWYFFVFNDLLKCLFINTSFSVMLLGPHPCFTYDLRYSVQLNLTISIPYRLYFILKFNMFELYGKLYYFLEFRDIFYYVLNLSKVISFREPCFKFIGNEHSCNKKTVCFNPISHDIYKMIYLIRISTFCWVYSNCLVTNIVMFIQNCYKAFQAS